MKKSNFVFAITTLTMTQSTKYNYMLCDKDDTSLYSGVDTSCGKLSWQTFRNFNLDATFEKCRKVLITLYHQ